VNRDRGKGFSLVEMALVLTVFSLMLGGMLVPLAKQYQFRREREAQRQLGEIVEALYGYALLHGRLPAAVGGDGLPWAALGAPRTDPWGRPWRYRVAAATAPCSPSAPIQVREADGTTVRVTAVVISGGKRAFPTEAENQDGDAVFVREEPAEDRFDDLLAWIHPTVLANRATLAGLCAAAAGGTESDDDDEDDDDD